MLSECPNLLAMQDEFKAKTNICIQKEESSSCTTQRATVNQDRIHHTESSVQNGDLVGASSAVFVFS